MFTWYLVKAKFLVLSGIQDWKIAASTVGEPRSGVTGFATINTSGSHRFMLQVRNDERCEIKLQHKERVNLTYHWCMYVIISPWNMIELCRTFRWYKATKLRQIVIFDVKTLGIIERNQWYRILTKIYDSHRRVVAGIYQYIYLAYFHVVSSPILPLISEWFPISSA